MCRLCWPTQDATVGLKAHAAAISSRRRVATGTEGGVVAFAAPARPLPLTGRNDLALLRPHVALVVNTVGHDVPGDVAGPARTELGEPLALVLGEALGGHGREVAHVVDRDLETLADA